MDIDESALKEHLIDMRKNIGDFEKTIVITPEGELTVEVGNNGDILRYLTQTKKHETSRNKSDRKRCRADRWR